MQLSISPTRSALPPSVSADSVAVAGTMSIGTAAAVSAVVNDVNGSAPASAAAASCSATDGDLSRLRPSRCTWEAWEWAATVLAVPPAPALALSTETGTPEEASWCSGKMTDGGGCDEEEDEEGGGMRKTASRAMPLSPTAALSAVEAAAAAVGIAAAANGAGDDAAVKPTATISLAAPSSLPSSSSPPCL